MAEKAEKAKGTIWYCNLCKVRGEVDFDGCRTISETNERVKEVHGKVSPDCKQPVWRIGIVNNATSKEEKKRVMEMPTA